MSYFTDLSSSLLQFPAALSKCRCRPGLGCEGTHKFSAQSKQGKVMINEYAMCIFTYNPTQKLVNFLHVGVCNNLH